MRMTGQEEFTALEQYIRSRSSKVKRSGSGIVFNCLYHNDNLPSASMKIGRNGMPMCCCSVCGSIYHQLKKDAGLWQDKADSGGFTPFEKFLYYNTEDEYKMYDFVTEKYLCSHFRMKDKEKQGFPRGIRDGEHVTKGTDGVDTTYAVFCNGHLKEVKNAIEKKSLVCYTEGEKDTKCLWNNDCISFTCGGTNTFKKELLPYLKGGRFAVFGDNDRAGIADAERITALLNTVGTAIMIIPPEVPEKGDISDYMKKHTKEDLQTLIKDALNKSTVKESVRHVENRKINLVDKLIELDAAKNYATNDKGSAELFSTVFKDVSRYNPTQKDWMYYNGIKWVADTEGMRAKRNAKELADALLSYAVSNPELDEKQRESYLKYASRLMNYRDRNTMINDAKDLNYFENEELDKEDFLLNCKNCVLDLSGDKPTILKHNADLLLSKVCNTSYEPAAQCPLWKKTISEIMEDDIGKIKYLQKVFGVSLTGCTAEEELYFFFGGSTRNGKSTVCESALFILADYGATISPETLAVKQNKDSRTASPDIAKLAGARLVIASEPPKRMIFDTSFVKTLTGRDRVTARFLHQNEFSFTPKFKLILNTNYLPTITDNTIFKSGRVRVVSFNKHFEESEQNKKLKDDLKAESAGILNWMIEGLYLYRREGLTPPAAVQGSTEEYENDSDKIGRFISECLVKSDKNVSAKTVYETYSKWCSASGCGIENKGNFFTELKVKGIFATSGTVNGRTVRNVVKGYELAEDDFVAVDDDTLLPFD